MKTDDPMTKDNDMPELKPCPFCGSKKGPFIHHQYGNGYQAKCAAANCYIGEEFATERAAIKAWNTRTPDKEALRAFELLMKALALGEDRLSENVRQLVETIRRALGGGE